MKKNADFNKILMEINQGLSEAVDEIITLSSEVATSQDGEYEGAEKFFIHANHPKNRQAIESYVFELLKAYGCCSLNIQTDDASSRKKLIDIEEQNPNFKWAKEVYLKNVSIDDLADDLTDEQINQYRQRLENWVN